MPPRGRGRARRQMPIESEAQNDEVEHSIPVRRRARQVDDEVDMLAARVDKMELIMARFQWMNPQTFNGDESNSNAESWLQHITGLFDRVHYDEVTVMRMNRMFIRWTRTRWAGPSPSLSLLKVDLDLITHNLTQTLTLELKSAASLPLLTPPPPPLVAAVRRTCSGQLFEENPLAIKSFNLLVQADRREIVSDRGPD
ncbi:hypothetical protein F511_12630 [Dorcoceras hygrometricum]|uniref:Uncharacterized protein n=1 Tax=Dorcoceras hygrometricum TaxID=472368 RepID=A0A2Z7CLW2_9LAMI|nr:hypothetical protein F511_12630 [Dorcoceras hygrometricum]